MNLVIDASSTRLGWIGTGVMGQSMCGHLVRAGYRMSVYTRTRSRAEALLEAGATWADSPREVADNADVVFTIVGYPSDVRAVMFGDSGVLSAEASPRVVVDMTTSSPALAIEIHAAAGTKGIVSLDAPVSGGDVGAREARLSIMVGGDEEAFRALEPLWQILGQRFVYQGSAGAGQHTKMVNQILIATGMIGICEALLYGYRAGLPLETVLESVASGAAGSWSLTNLGPRILANRFEPGFFVEHFVKDMEIALAEARRMNLSLPGLALAHQLYVALKAQGHARDGTHALELALARLSGIDWMRRG